MRAVVFALMLGLPMVAVGQVGLNPAEVAPGRLLLDIQKAQVTGTVMYVAAHPDDENTALLAYLALGRQYRTVYLSLTRGDGGQNLIGTEQGELLGIIRTHELLQARRIDGAEQRFTRAIDLGYCKNPEEAYQQWPHDSVLADVVWAIRSVRPDVIICRFPTDGGGGHGHHTASALIAEEAFAAAADPKRFVEQLRWVQPWQVKRLYWNAWTPGSRPGQPSNAPAPTDWIGLDVGAYNPLIGMSYTEVAGLSRSQHQSQGFGAAQRRGSRIEYLKHLLGPPATRDPMEGVAVGWERYGLPAARLAAIQQGLSAAEHSFSPTQPWLSAPGLAAALKALQDALAAQPNLTATLAHQRAHLERTLLRSLGFYAELTAADFTTAQGAPVATTLSLLQRSPLPVQVEINGRSLSLEPNQLVTTEQSLIADRSSTPHWLSEPAVQGLYPTPLPERGQAAIDPAPRLRVNVLVSGTRLALDVPLQHRWVDPTAGDRYRAVEAGPAAVVSFDERAYLFTGGARTVGVRVVAHTGAATGQLSLQVPAGWAVSPLSQPFALAAREADTLLQFTVQPPSRPTADASASITASITATLSGHPALSRTRLAYNHIPYQVVFSPAAARLTQAQVQCAAQRAGYLMGAGDEVPAALRQLGITVEPLTPQQVIDAPAGALSRFDAIVVGVRAYNVDASVVQWLPRLLRYAEGGGTVIVQYQTTASLLARSLGPYPFALTRVRIADERAPLTAVLPDHPVLSGPNKITARDFDGWVQERGLYFAGSIDARYATPLEGNDPGEPPARGMLLVAPYGQGAFVYTGLAFFRQLPAGVPGAYRLFANLLSLRGSQLPKGPSNRP